MAADGKVFITDPQRAMTAIDIETGNTVWRTFQSMVRETMGLSEDKEHLQQDHERQYRMLLHQR